MPETADVGGPAYTPNKGVWTRAPPLPKVRDRMGVGLEVPTPGDYRKPTLSACESCLTS